MNPVSVASLLAASLYQGNHDRNHNDILCFRLWQKNDEVDTILGQIKDIAENRKALIA